MLLFTFVYATCFLIRSLQNDWIVELSNGSFHFDKELLLWLFGSGTLGAIHVTLFFVHGASYVNTF